MKKDNIIGKTFYSNRMEECIVLSKKYSKNTETYFEVEFTKTGSKKVIEKRHLKKGSFVDDFNKHIYNVACKGSVSSKFPILNKIAFKRWYAMIERCYNTSSIGYSGYGNVGITVCERWLCFANFLEDINKISGYTYDLYISGDIQLDKDTKIIGNKLYSPETCVFLNRIQNIRHQTSRIKKFIAIDINGNEFNYNTLAECARTHNLDARGIRSVLLGIKSTHRNFTFKYV